MVFYINKTIIKIEYSFFLIIAFSLLLGNKNILFLILFSALHELGHLLVLLLCGGQPSKLTVSFYGIGLKHEFEFPPIKEILFLLAGAFVNILFCLLGIKTEINFPLAVINLLPLYPLDGGRVLKIILNNFNFSEKVFKAVTIIFVIILIAFSVYRKNVSLILISVYIIVFSLNNSFD